MKEITRRELLASGAGLGLLAAAGPTPLAAAPGKRTDIVDAHVHVWTPDTEKISPGPRGSAKRTSGFPSFTPEDLAVHSRPPGGPAHQPDPDDLVRPRPQLYSGHHRRPSPTTTWGRESSRR